LQEMVTVNRKGKGEGQIEMREERGNRRRERE
jgi:hypothetical protein